LYKNLENGQCGREKMHSLHAERSFPPVAEILAQPYRTLESGVFIFRVPNCSLSKFRYQEAGMDEYPVRTWQGWHHHMALSLIAVWFLIGETHRGQQSTPALTLPPVRYGLSMLLLGAFCTLSLASLCRHIQRQLLRNELARFYHHHTRNCLPPKKLRRDIQ
jgi:hypothetical protein